MRGHDITIPTPRCPFCESIMQECQLKWEEKPNAPHEFCWHEVWWCDSCHTNHVFPARYVFLEYVRNSQQLERGRRITHLPI